MQVLILFSIFHKQVLILLLKLVLKVMSNSFFEKYFLAINERLPQEDYIWENILLDRWEIFIASKGFKRMDELVFYLRPYPDYLFFDRIGDILINNHFDLEIDESILFRILKIKDGLNDGLKQVIEHIKVCPKQS